MKYKILFLSFLYSFILFADEQSYVIQDYNASTDKLFAKEMLEENWYQLCGGYVHGYQEPLASRILEESFDFFKVLYQDNEIVGFIIFNKKSDNRMHIDTLVIDKKYRNQGFGSILLQQAFDICVLLGIEFITIDTMLSNHGSRNLYQYKFGFVPLYLKNYISSELNQESDPVIALGRTIDMQLWSDKIKKLIISDDFIDAQYHDYRITEVL